MKSDQMSATSTVRVRRQEGLRPPGAIAEITHRNKGYGLGMERMSTDNHLIEIILF